MSWSLEFDQPIIANGKTLRTLRDAANHIMALPPRETKKAHWLLAVQCLVTAAEKRGFALMAQIAMTKAINAKSRHFDKRRSVIY
jgi:hypothetical protein